MRTKEFWSSLFFLSLAAVLYWQTRGMVVWEEMGPSEGFFPLVLSLVLGLLNAGKLADALFRRRTPNLQVFGERRRKFLAYSVSFFAFGLAFARAGYSLSLALFLLFILKAVERQTWKLTIPVIFFSILFSYGLFQRFFGIPLPEGILTPLINQLR